MRRDYVVELTQYLRPHGTPTKVYTHTDEGHFNRWKTLLEKGYRLECEVLTTGEVSLTVSDDEADHRIKICNNGPQVPIALDELIDEGFELVQLAKIGPHD